MCALVVEKVALSKKKKREIFLDRLILLEEERMRIFLLIIKYIIFFSFIRLGGIRKMEICHT